MIGNNYEELAKNIKQLIKNTEKNHKKQKDKSEFFAIRDLRWGIRELFKQIASPAYKHLVDTHNSLYKEHK